MPRIIDSILVNDNSPNQSTEINQRVPVATVAGKPRRFDREYGPDATLDRSPPAGARSPDA